MLGREVAPNRRATLRRAAGPDGTMPPARRPNQAPIATAMEHTRGPFRPGRCRAREIATGPRR
jgi:hypothetical protein